MKIRNALRPAPLPAPLLADSGPQHLHAPPLRESQSTRSQYLADFDCWT
jgi:hypothetical protein